MRYAQILNGRAHWIFESNESMKDLCKRFTADTVFKDITGVVPQPEEGWIYNTNKTFSAPVISEVSLSSAKENKLEELRIAAANSYISGFTSSALGTQWFYDSSIDDQRLIEGLYQRAQEADWSTLERYQGICPAGYAPIRARQHTTDPESEKQVRLHDGAQLITLGRDLEFYLFLIKKTNWGLQEAVSAATSIEQVNSIVWPL